MHAQGKAQPVPLLRFDFGAKEGQQAAQQNKQPDQPNGPTPSQLLDSMDADEAGDSLQASMAYEEERRKRILYTDPDLHLNVSSWTSTFALFMSFQNF